MSGIANGNLIAFRFAEDVIARTLGAEVICPIDIEPDKHEGPCPTVGPPKAQGSDHLPACNLKADISMMVTCQYVIFLEGWQASAGSRLEMTVATQCGIPVLFFNSVNGTVRDANGGTVRFLA